MTAPRMGQDIHFVPPKLDLHPASRRLGVRERHAEVTEVGGDDTVCLVSFNRTGIFFGEDIPHDPAGGEWTWHAVEECPWPP